MMLSDLLRILQHMRLRSIFYCFMISFSGLVFTSSLFMARQQNERGFFRKRGRFLQPQPRQRTIVIIFSQRRSGTTFMGEIFGTVSNSFYLFEPLAPFGINCEALKNEKITTLRKILNCDFSEVSKDYATALNVTHYPDGYAKCVKNNICFADKNGNLIIDYARTCSLHQSYQIPGSDQVSDDCGFPMKSEYLSQLCKSSSLVAVKVVRFCSLIDLKRLYTTLSSTGSRVFVVHLVRDPRAVLASTLEVGLDGMNSSTLDSEAKALCLKHRENLRYLADSRHNEVLRKNIVNDERYLRVRFEDFASDTLGTVRELFSFIGIEVSNEVKRKIKKSQYNISDITKRSKNGDVKERIEANLALSRMIHPFGTVRDPRQVLQKWRWSLSFEMVRKIQNECSDVMDALRYNLFHSFSDLSNFSLSSFY